MAMPKKPMIYIVESIAGGKPPVEPRNGKPALTPDRKHNHQRRIEMRSFLRLICSTAILSLGIVSTPAWSADIPCDTAKLIVPWKAGGGTDVDTPSSDHTTLFTHV